MRWNPPNTKEEVVEKQPMQNLIDESDYTIDEEGLQCPCGRLIKNPKEYEILFIKKKLYEIHILCPNQGCHLEELGKIRFFLTGKAAKVEEAFFNTFFYSWNSQQLGEEKTKMLLEKHLKTIVAKIDWQAIIDKTKTKL